MTSSLMLEVWTYVLFSISFASMFRGSLHSDRCSSAKAKTRSQLWINTLSQCEKGETSQHPFIKTMRKLVDSFKSVIPLIVSNLENWFPT